MNPSPFPHPPNVVTGFGEQSRLALSYPRAGTNGTFVSADGTECPSTYTATMAYGGQPVTQGSEVAFGAQRDLSSADLEMNDKLQTGPFICVDCNRQFLRYCDLNKHAKTHTRPFKCPVDGCKFASMGWPTEKELQRHHNDVHSSKPQIFTCLYQGCPYTSKRESNLKQHMEKTHGYHYVRSRSSRSYRCPAAGCSDCFSPDDTRQRHGTPVSAPAGPGSLDTFQGQDFVLYPGLRPSPLSATTVYPDGPDDLWNNSYVPWASPPSRGQDLSKFLQSMESIIKVPSPMPLDPQLAQPYVSTAQVTPCFSPRQPELLSAPQSLANVPLKMSCSPPTYTLATPGEEWSTAGNYTTSKGPSSTSVSGPSGAPAGSSSVAVIPITPQSNRRRRPVPDENDGDSCDDTGSDEEPPKKRTKHMPEEEFDEKKMPCPFWLLDPNYFCRETQERFSPCHTKHKEVSTIV